MTDKKISQLSNASTPLAGTEVLPIVQSGSTVKVSVANLTAGRTVDATTVNATTVDATNIEVTNIKAKDGTAAISIADSTGAVTASSGSTLNGGVVINELGADADTRIEGDTDANLFFVDASTDRIGMGTASPGVKLQVVGDIGVSGADRSIYNLSNNALLLGTNSGERMRIVAGGAVGVNITNPNVFSQFCIKWDATASATNNGVGLGILVAANTTNATFAQWYNEVGDSCGSITRVAQTNAVNYNVSSDRRLKENILPADDAGEIIDAIEIVKHDWKNGGSIRYGVIAQDLYNVAPEAVSPGDLNDVDKLKKPWGVDYSKLVPILVKEIQSLRARIATLEGA